MAIIGVRTRTALAAAATLALSVVVPVGVAGAAPPPAGQYGAGTGTPYANPVSKGFADTFADPSVIRGQGRLVVRLRHHRPAAGGRDAPGTSCRCRARSDLVELGVPR